MFILYIKIKLLSLHSTTTKFMKQLRFNTIIMKEPVGNASQDINSIEDFNLGGLVKKEVLMVYCFRPENIVSYRESITTFEDAEVSCIICNYMVQGIYFQSPYLISTLEDFEKKLIEYENN